ncbi:MAG: vWA domain-containing protein [Amylibacter sp.]
MKQNLLALAICTLPIGASGADCSRDAMLVFDGSGSMATLAAEAPFSRRIDDARNALAQFLPRVVRYRRVGLVVYGPGSLGPCENVDVRLMPQVNADLNILAQVADVEPDGDTPMTQAIDAAVEVLRDRGGGDIVVVTDGRQTCGDPCSKAAQYAEQGMVVHVIGFKIDENFQRWPGYFAESGGLKREPSRCLSDATDGIFVLTNTVEELSDALQETMGCAVVGRWPTTYRQTRYPV